MDLVTALLLLGAGVWAGAQNALAGGGAFISLPVLMLSGLDARAANLTSTIALFPGQVVVGVGGRGLISETTGLPLPLLVGVNLAGGALGAGLLLATPSSIFSSLVPWLILFATAIFAWSSFRPRRDAATRRFGPVPFACVQSVLAIYGGYFGGGNGFLMLAALSLVGLAARNAAALKNLLLVLINAAAVVVFCFSPSAAFREAALLGSGAIVGGMAGNWLLHRVNETALRVGVVLIGLALTAWLLRPLAA